MVRLPQPGSDSGTWGEILNEFLRQTHKTDGSLKDGVVTSSSLASNAVNESVLGTSGGSNGQVLIKDSAQASGIKWGDVTVGASTPSGPAGGDLSGTYPNPTVPGLATKANDSAVVHLTGAETVTGAKNFTGGLSVGGQAVVTTSDARLSDQRIPTNASVTPAKLVADTPVNGDILSYNGSGFEWVVMPTSSGEANTASNIGTSGVGLYKQKTGTNLEFKKLNAGSNKVTITDDLGSNEVDIDIVTANLGLAKADVGLANVDNTSDLAKPISTATQTALNAKAATVHAHAITDTTGLQTALDAKAVASTTVTGTTSLTGGGDLSTNRTLSLVGDVATPGNSRYYGTDGTGTKGYHALPAGSAPPDATNAVKGLIQLTGDLGGTATSPTVPGLAGKASTVHTHAIADTTGLQTVIDGKEATITAGTNAQYYRGDKTWQTLNKTAVGLANVDNTSDANKPISTATQTALNAKADATSIGNKVILIDNASALPVGTPAGVIVVVKA